ncbi:hypothetical protein Bbelb_073460 [Branchiostoma belcheri]|nr:hypothetical protein Bbelb_073460 [Branchiostoma belcheri]
MLLNAGVQRGYGRLPAACPKGPIPWPDSPAETRCVRVLTPRRYARCKENDLAISATTVAVDSFYDAAVHVNLGTGINTARPCDHTGGASVRAMATTAEGCSSTGDSKPSTTSQSLGPGTPCSPTELPEQMGSLSVPRPSQSQASPPGLGSTTLTKRAVPPVALIPCQVCGDVSVGFHCGACVCEACKILE